MWQDGRNCYSNSRGYLERRPGFGATVELVPTVFNNVQRLFTWERWDGTPNAGFYLMISDLGNDNKARVYKYWFGHDVSAHLIFTSSTWNAFDFTESNNWCFFGNGTDMMKFDGDHLYKWGIVAPPQAPSVTTDSGYIAGSADTAEGVYYVYSYGCSLTGHESSSSRLSPKVVPLLKTIVVSTVPGLFNAVTAYYWGDSPHSGPVGSYIWCNPSDTAAISAGATSRTTDTADGSTLGSSLMFDATKPGSPSSPMEWTIFDSSGSGKSLGLQPVFASKLAGSSTGFDNFNMCVTVKVYLPAPGTYTFAISAKDEVMWGFDDSLTWAGKGTVTGSKGQSMTTVSALPLLPVTVTNDGVGYTSTGSVDVTATAAGEYDFEVDYDYWYHGGRHLVVTCNGVNIYPAVETQSIVISNDVGVTASSDPQVDQIHVYRTTIGGSANPSEMQELPASPFPNTTQIIRGETANDTDLQLSYAPGFYSNNPPTPSQFFIWSQNRISGAANNTLYYSGFEEIIKGVPEECWPGGVDGNYHPYKRAIHSLAAMPTGVDVLTASTQYGVDGDSLDTFRWLTLSEKRGTKTHACTLTLGSSVLWFDTSRQIWSSGGQSGLASALGTYQWRSTDSGEIGLDIRPDLLKADPAQSAMAVHIAGQFHWLVFMDGENGKLWVLNLDTGQWQVPWTVPATAIHSGETADGQVDLMVALNGTTLVKLTPGTFTDHGQKYDAWIRGNLFALGKGEQTAVVDYLEIERNPVPLTDVLQANDEDTQHATYVSIFANKTQPPQRGNGKNVIAELYRSYPEEMNTGSSACKRASFELHWGVSDQKFELYTLDVAYHPAVSK